MQLRKLAAAGALSALMAGSSLGFAAGLADYPQPFVSATGTADFLIVVGSQGTDPAGLASDVAAAIDVAASLGSRATKTITVGASTGGVSLSGEGKEVATTNTKLFLNDHLGKSGVRNTLTKDDLPILLADGQFIDSDASLTSNYQQFIYLTPGTATDSAYQIRYGKPGLGGTEDPVYKIGEIATSPSTSAYLYRLSVTFDQSINGTTAVGETITLYGKKYTVHADTSKPFAGTTSDKLVLSGGADIATMKGGEVKQVEISGTTYEVELLGVSSTPAASMKVTNKATGVSESKLNVGVGSSVKLAGLDVYVDSASQLSSTDQTQNLAKIQLGSQKLTLQHGTSVKEGDQNTVVKGTYVSLTRNSGKLDAIDLYMGATDSNKDALVVGGEMVNPLFKTFKVSFPTLSTALDSMTSRDKITVQNSGNNLMTVTFTDWRGKQGTLSFANTEGGTTASLQDDSPKTIHVVENATISQDQYFVADAGDFGRIFKVTSVSFTSDASSSISLSDVMSGDSLTVSNLGSDDDGSKVIDGQTYYFTNATSSTFRVTWGASSGNEATGTYTTVYPVVKTQKGAHLAFIDEGAITVNNGTLVQLPTGAVTIRIHNASGVAPTLTVATSNNEDGTTTGSAVFLTNSVDTNTTVISVGSTASGRAKYNITVPAGVAGNQYNIRLVDENNSTLTNAALLLVEEKDDNSDKHVVYIPLAVATTSGTNQVEVGTVSGSDRNSTLDHSGAGSNTMVAWSKTDSNVQSGVDLYGTYVIEDTDGQDTATIWYPDEQVVANIFVLTDAAITTTVSGSGGTTVREAVPITTAVARLDSEVQADQTAKTTKNLILVGGPVVNSLVADLAAESKTWNRQGYLDNGEGTYILDYIDGAFATGKAALVIAGHSAADTRMAARELLNPALTGMRVAKKNGVVITEPAATPETTTTTIAPAS